MRLFRVSDACDLAIDDAIAPELGFGAGAEDIPSSIWPETVDPELMQWLLTAIPAS